MDELMFELSQENLYNEGIELIGKGDYEEIAGFLQKLRDGDWDTLADTLQTEWDEIQRARVEKSDSDEQTYRSMQYGI